MQRILAGLCLLVLGACNEGGGFQGGTQEGSSPANAGFLPESGDAEAEPDTTPANNEVSPVDAGLEPTTEATPVAEAALAEEDAGALADCLKQWPDHKFTPEQIANPIKYLINQGVDNNSLVFSDESQSPAAQLKLVTFDIRNGNQSELLLGDENGWYCLYFKAKIVNNFTVNQQCGSRLAIVSQQAQNMNNFVVNEICE